MLHWAASRILSRITAPQSRALSAGAARNGSTPAAHTARASSDGYRGDWITKGTPSYPLTPWPASSWRANPTYSTASGESRAPCGLAASTTAPAPARLRASSRQRGGPATALSLGSAGS